MRLAWVFALLLLAGCSLPVKQSTPVPAAGAGPLNSCTEPRPELCTLEYLPVCASLAAGGAREYASGCSACADVAVTGYYNGPCSQ